GYRVPAQRITVPPRGAASRRRNRWQCTADCRRHAAELDHEIGELFWVERLGAIRKCTVRLRMHLHDDAVRTGSDRCSRHRCHHVAQARTVTWICDDREMRQLVHHWNRSQVEHVANRGIEGPNSALAQNYLTVSLGKNVFGAEQEIRDRGGHSTLQEHRPPQLADGLEKRIIL